MQASALIILAEKPAVLHAFYMQAVSILVDIHIRPPAETNHVVPGAGSNEYRLHHPWSCKPHCKAFITGNMPALSQHA